MSENTAIYDESRRSLLLQGTILAGVAAFGLMAGRAANAAVPSSIPGSGDIQVLNYALQLEDLEADLYAQAILRLQGGGTTAKTSASVGTITGLALPDSNLIVTYLKKFAPVEAAHRDYLISALGPQAITTLAPKKYNFGLQSLDANGVLNLVLEAEATGVQAYLGAITSFSTQSRYLAVAAAIQGTEARHTSVLTVVRNLLVAQGLDTSDALTATAPLVGDAGSNATANTYDPTRPNRGDSNGIDLSLTPDQVITRVTPFIKTT